MIVINALFISLIFQFFLKYGPDYSLEITPLHFRENKNSVRYIKKLLSTLKGAMKILYYIEFQIFVT